MSQELPTDPQSWTWSQASDPSTPAASLAEIAAQRPDLRAAVATNPATYPALRDWLGTLGDPFVDQALAVSEPVAGEAAEAAGESAAALAQQWGGASEAAAAEGTPGAPAEAAYAAGAPGIPQAQAYAGAPATIGGQQGQYAGQPGQQGQYAGQPGQVPLGGYQPPRRGLSGGVIAAIVVGALVLVGGAFGGGFAAGRASAVVSSIYDYDGYDSGSGSNATYYSNCESGNMVACDDLYWGTLSGTSDETFGATCGNRASWEEGTCESRYGSSW